MKRRSTGNRSTHSVKRPCHEAILLPAVHSALLPAAQQARRYVLASVRINNIDNDAATRFRRRFLRQGVDWDPDHHDADGQCQA